MIPGDSAVDGRPGVLPEKQGITPDPVFPENALWIRYDVLLQ